MSKDINCIVAQDLADDPTLLLHKRVLWGQERTPFDGKVGAVIENGEMFVMSPNMDIIYTPPLGKTRVMCMREDFRFGDDDPWQWPQPYSTSLCHFAAIPRQPLDENDPTSIMWWTPTRESFVSATTSIITGVGTLEQHKLNLLRKVITDVLSRFETYKRDPLHPITNQRTIIIANSLHHAFSRLESLPTNRRSVFFGVTQVQRCFLELTALLDYICIYKPRMDGITPAASSVSHTIGAFAFEATVVQEFVRAGLPVWVVRSYTTLPAIRIDTIKEPFPPQGIICLEGARPPFTPFFTGAGTDNQKYVALAMYMRSFVSYPNPFECITVAPQPSSSTLPKSSRVPQKTPFESIAVAPQPSSSTLPKSSRVPQKAGRPQPYTKRPLQANTKGGRNKFADLSSPIVPPAIPVWRDALLSVDTDLANIVYETRPHDAGYVFPDPGLFVGATSPERQAKYMYHWIKHRTEMIYRLTPAQSSAHPISGQLWRDLLTFGGMPTEASSGEANTKAAKRRQQIVEMFGDSVTADGVEVRTTNLPSSEVFWRDQQISAGILPTETVAQEVLWELSELNFRFELLALDQRASTVVDDYATRQDKVLACFPTFSLLVADTKDAARGLAAEVWTDRVPFLLAMARLMKGWVNAPAIVTSVAEKPVEQLVREEVNAVECAMAKFYTQSFYNFFARAAIVPRRLVVHP